MPKEFPFPIKDYLELVDLTRSCIREDKFGFIDESNCNILVCLNISPENCLKLTIPFEHYFKNAVGSPDLFSKYC